MLVPMLASVWCWCDMVLVLVAVLVVLSQTQAGTELGGGRRRQRICYRDCRVVSSCSRSASIGRLTGRIIDVSASVLFSPRM